MEEGSFDTYSSDLSSKATKTILNNSYQDLGQGMWMNNTILNFLRIFFVAIIFFYICKSPPTIIIIDQIHILSLKSLISFL